MSWPLKVGAVVLGVGALLGAIVLGLIGIRRLSSDAEALGDQELHSYATWTAFLGRHVHPDGVDYDGLLADEDLARVVASFEASGPRSQPALFPTKQHELAYYINAYNALTLFGVASRWPIDSVQDVRGRIEVTPGFGFFWGLRFRLDRRGTNLYDLENKVIRPKYGDARIHAALNCASESCPTLQSTAFRAETLDVQLDDAARGFVGSDKHVRWDAEAKTVHLSSIFTWFRSDFEQHSRALGSDAETLAWIERYTQADDRRALAARARSEGWALSYTDYDWSLNRRP